MKKYDGVLKRVRQIEEKNGIIYAKTDGKLYNTLKVLYTILGVFTLLINITYIVSCLLRYSAEEYFEVSLNPVISVAVCSFLLILGYIFIKYKLNLLGGIVSFIPLVFLIFIFGSVLNGGTSFLGYYFSFYWRHFTPLCLMIFFIIWLTVIALRAEIKTNKLYKRVTNNLFEMFNKKDTETSELTEKDWEQFLENYQHEYKNQFLKDSEEKIEE